MTFFIMMVGLPASGKSTVAREFVDIYKGSVLISSDSYRKTHYGDEAIQGDNNSLFDEMHRNILSNLDAGVSVIFDATNIAYKKRMHLLDKMKKMPVTKIACIMATPVSTCLERNAKRDRVVPDEVILRMWKSFTMPQYFEGFDYIEIRYDEYDKMHYNTAVFMNRIENFQQDTSYHAFTLGEHTGKVVSVLNSIEAVQPMTRIAGLLHDNGKEHTKTFTTMKGLPSQNAHYYGHENCGAYEALFYVDANYPETVDAIWIAGLIQLHMRPYMTESEKAKDKLKNLIGDVMYEQLMFLHYADVQAH